MTAEPHPSASTEQQHAQQLAREALGRQLGVPLERASIDLPGGSRVEIGAVDEGRTVFAEISVRQGKVKGGQRHKVAQDALKLITVTRDRPDARRILAFADDVAADDFRNRSWLAEALSLWDIELITVPLFADVLDGLRAAQARQVMVNPPD